MRTGWSLRYMGHVSVCIAEGDGVTMFATGKVTNERWTCAEEGFLLVTTTNLSATLREPSLSSERWNGSATEHKKAKEKIGQLIESEDIYKRRGKKKLYVVYCLEGEVVLYKTKRKTVIHTGFKDPIFTLKPLKLSKFAVLKRADMLRSLTVEEIRSMKLKKYENNYIKLFIPE